MYVIEVGGTYLRSAWSDGSFPTHVDKIMTPRPSRTSRESTAAKLIDTIAASVQRLDDVAPKSDSLAISCAGIMDLQPVPNARTYGPLRDHDVYVTAVNVGLVNFPLQRELERHLGMQVHIENDNNAAARSVGSGADVALVMIGTGLSASVLRNGEIQRAGLDWGCIEIGHGFRTTLPEELLRKCTCGAFGCAEAAIGGWALKERFGVDPQAASPDVLAQMYTSVLEVLPLLVAPMLDRFTVDNVLLAGGVLQEFEKSFDVANDLRDRFANLRSSTSSVAYAELGEMSGLQGVALAALDAGLK